MRCTGDRTTLTGSFPGSWLDEFECSDGFRFLFEQAGIGMAELDSRLRVREANDDLLRQTDRRPLDTYGRLFVKMLHHTVRKDIERELGELVAGRRERLAEDVLVNRADGTLIPGGMTAVAVGGPSGEVDTVLVLINMQAKRDAAAVPVPAGKLVLREVDARILEGVAAGVSTVKLASTLFMSRGGVEYRVTALLRMMRVPNRPALISKAHSIGMFNTEIWPPKVLPEFVGN